ncbi:Hypothetical predicted protein, partial [Paramuricea clavata]
LEITPRSSCIYASGLQLNQNVLSPMLFQLSYAVARPNTLISGNIPVIIDSGA